MLLRGAGPGEAGGGARVLVLIMDPPLPVVVVNVVFAVLFPSWPTGI